MIKSPVQDVEPKRGSPKTDRTKGSQYSTVQIRGSSFKPVGKDSVLVIDNGSRFIKAGIAGEQVPRALIPTLVGKSKGEVLFGNYRYSKFLTVIFRNGSFAN
jgi:hypothetical protein